MTPLSLPISSSIRRVGGGLAAWAARSLVALAVLFAGAVPGAAAHRLKVIFVSPGHTGEVFWDMVADTMQAAADQLDVDLQVLRAERNRFRMKDIGHAVVSAPTLPDYLILVNEEQSAGDVLIEADRRGIKTLLILNDIIGDESGAFGEPRTKLRSWIGSLVPDSRAAGRRMAEALFAQMRRSGPRDGNGHIHMLAIGGDTITPTSIARNLGLADALAGQTDIVLDRMLMANWNEVDAMAAAQRYLDWAGRNVIVPAGVWAANDPMAFGAMAAFEAHGRVSGRDFGIVGLNWSGDAVKAIEEGRMIMSDGAHFFGGAWAMVMLRDYHDGCDFAATRSRQVFPTAAIDRSNAAIFGPMLIAENFSGIDFTRFSACRNATPGRYDFSMPRIIEAMRPVPAGAP